MDLPGDTFCWHQWTQEIRTSCAMKWSIAPSQGRCERGRHQGLGGARRHARLRGCAPDADPALFHGGNSAHPWPELHSPTFPRPSSSPRPGSQTRGVSKPDVDVSWEELPGPPARWRQPSSLAFLGTTSSPHSQRPGEPSLKDPDSRCLTLSKESRNTLTHLQVYRVYKPAEHQSSFLISLKNKRVPQKGLYNHRAFKVGKPSKVLSAFPGGRLCQPLLPDQTTLRPPLPPYCLLLRNPDSVFPEHSFPATVLPSHLDLCSCLRPDPWPQTFSHELYIFHRWSLPPVTWSPWHQPVLVSLCVKLRNSW